MEGLLSKVNVHVPDRIFLKDPLSSELGRKIINMGISMIDEIGFESFTFRKLASTIDSTEASVYRYFESKHKLLLYLTSWYWGWMEIRLVFITANINDPIQKMERVVELLTKKEVEIITSDLVDISMLKNIVVAESSKAYLTREVDDENKDGAFLAYKRFVERASEVVLENCPGFKYPHMLISTIVEGAHHQRFFADHLPRLTDQIEGEDTISDFFKEVVMKAIAPKKSSNSNSNS